MASGPFLAAGLELDALLVGHDARDQLEGEGREHEGEGGGAHEQQVHLVAHEVQRLCSGSRTNENSQSAPAPRPRPWRWLLSAHRAPVHGGEHTEQGEAGEKRNRKVKALAAHVCSNR